MRAAVAANPIVEVVDTSVHVYFQQRAFDEEKSCQLEVLANRILVAADGVLAMTFDTDALSEL